MPTKLLTLVFGLAAGIGIAFAIQGLSDLSDADPGQTSTGRGLLRADDAARAVEMNGQYKRYYISQYDRYFNSGDINKSGVATHALNSANSPAQHNGTNGRAAGDQARNNDFSNNRQDDRRRANDFASGPARDNRWNDGDNQWEDADPYDQPDRRYAEHHYFAQYRPSRFESDDRRRPSRWHDEDDRADNAWDEGPARWQTSQRSGFDQDQYADAGDYRRDGRGSWSDSQYEEYRRDSHRGPDFAARPEFARADFARADFARADFARADFDRDEMNDDRFADNRSGGYGHFGQSAPGGSYHRWAPEGPPGGASLGPVRSRDFAAGPSGRWGQSGRPGFEWGDRRPQHFAAHGPWGPGSRVGHSPFGHPGFRSGYGEYGHHGWQQPRDFGHHRFAAHGHWHGPFQHYRGDHFAAAAHGFHGRHHGHHGHHGWGHRHHFGHHSFAGHHRHFGGHHGFYRGHGWGHRHHGGDFSFAAHHHWGSHHHGHFHHGHFRGRHSGRHHGWAHHHGWHHGGHQCFGAGPARFAQRWGGHGPTHFPGAFGPQGSPFARIDENHDGKISKDELLKIFTTIDANADGSVTREELIKALAKSAEGQPPSAPGNSSDKSADQPGQRPAGPHGRGPGGFGPPGVPGQFGPGGRGPMGRPTAEGIFERFDTDKKGSLTKDSVPQRLWNRISDADTDKDGSVSKEELETFLKNHGFGRPNPNKESKPADKPQNENPEPPKAEDPKANAMRDDSESPVDALAADGTRTYDGI